MPLGRKEYLLYILWKLKRKLKRLFIAEDDNNNGGRKAYYHDTVTR